MLDRHCNALTEACSGLQQDNDSVAEPFQQVVLLLQPVRAGSVLGPACVQRQAEGGQKIYALLSPSHQGRSVFEKRLSFGQFLGRILCRVWIHRQRHPFKQPGEQKLIIQFNIQVQVLVKV